jgi:DNA-binding MarR family transcriptional regulator
MATFEVLEAYVTLRREVALIRAAQTKDLEFGHNQISVLYRLSLSPANMGELAEYALTDKASMTRTVALLEKSGFVTRRPDPADRRVVNISLTAKGKSQARKAQAIRSAVGKKLDSALSPAERKKFVSLVQKITAPLRNESPN